MMNRESFRMVKKTIVIDQATQTEEQDFLTKGTAALVSSVVTISKQYNPITLVNLLPEVFLHASQPNLQCEKGK